MISCGKEKKIKEPTTNVKNAVEVEEVFVVPEYGDYVKEIPLKTPNPIVGYVFYTGHNTVYQGEEISMIYTIQKGDRLLDIAGRFGLSWNKLLENNKQIDNIDMIYQEDRLFLQNITKFPFENDIKVLAALKKGFAPEEVFYYIGYTYNRTSLNDRRYYKTFYIDDNGNIQKHEFEGILGGKSEDRFYLNYDNETYYSLNYEIIESSSNYFLINMGKWK